MRDVAIKKKNRAYDAVMKKVLLFIGSAILVLVTGFYAFNAYIYSEKQGGPSGIKAYRGTLTGEMTCLPHADTKGPQTLECAIGMKTDVGEYYALDFSLMPDERPDIQSGDRFTATGLITPIEMLSNDQWKKYDVQGIFSVTDTVERL